MNKTNVFRSSSFHMAEGDILHMLIKEEVGVTADIRLVSGGDTSNVDEVPDAPLALDASDITSNSFTANWHFMENTTGFYLDVATDEDFTAFVVGYEDLDVGYVNEYSVVGLDDAVIYYYRLRGYNDIGTGIDSNIITLTTEVEIVADGDGNIYAYVTIGTQQWIIENLYTTRYMDGTAIPNLILDANWIADITGAYCWYNNDAVTYADYGCLYNWYAVMSVHGLAPTGWRVPSAADWTTLITYIGGLLTSGGKLKEIEFAHWLIPNTGATDEYGFCALAGGHRNGADGFFDAIQRVAELFKTDEVLPDSAEVINILYNSIEITDSDDYKTIGISVRCMRDV